MRIAVAGISGRMGSLIAKQVMHDQTCILSVITSRNENAMCGELKAQSWLSPNFDVLIDFSLPIAALENLKFCVAHNKPLVIGATGFTDVELHAIQDASKAIPIFKANNMSIGAHACNLAVKQIARLLDESWQITIEESHHQTKRDAPSGTALMLSESIKSAGFTNDLRINSIRDEQTIGIHKIVFSNRLESIELSHVALSREIFASGALKAAKWLANQLPGLFNMENL